MTALPPSTSWSVAAAIALVAPNIKVLYTSTPKAACTTIKLMLAVAEGSHRPQSADRLAVMHFSRAQTIHHPSVHGLRTLADLPEDEQRHILTSPDWLRIASVRDPISRAYSAWENRILLRGHRRTSRLIERSPDVLSEGRLDIAASFSHFAKALSEDADAFMHDHHFLPQAHLVQPHAIGYSMLVRVDQPGQMDALASVLSDRSGKTIAALRLNEGLGVKVERVCDVHTANRLMAAYAMDYAAFGFAHRSWANDVEPLLLSDREMRLLTHYRNSFERAISVARESQRRTGLRYGVSQMRQAVQQALRIGRPHRGSGEGA